MADTRQLNEITRLNEDHSAATRAADVFKHALGGSRTAEILRAIDNSDAFKRAKSLPPQRDETIKRATEVSRALQGAGVFPDQDVLETARRMSQAAALPAPHSFEEARGRERADKPPQVLPAPRAIRTPEALGELVRQARESMGLSQTAFADLVGVGRRFVSELENGKATLELGKVMAVCSAAGVDLIATFR